jgi:hypothetical protein
VGSFINSNERLLLNNENLKVVIIGSSVIIDLDLVNKNSKALLYHGPKLPHSLSR